MSNAMECPLCQTHLSDVYHAVCHFQDYHISFYRFMTPGDTLLCGLLDVPENRRQTLDAIYAEWLIHRALQK